MTAWELGLYYAFTTSHEVGSTGAGGPGGIRAASDMVNVNSSAASQKGWLMPKALCLIGLVLAILVFLIFFLDLVLGMSGAVRMAPLKYASVMNDIIFMIAAGGLAWISWATFREQK